MEDEITKEFNQIEVQLIEGSGGIFKVIYNGTPIFSKLDLIGTHSERFPEVGEITTLIHAYDIK